jgi:transglutaminase-like putative cysteine protease
LLDHTEDLLRIQWTATLPRGSVLRAVWWTNRQGEVMKMQLDALHQVTYRATREVALAEGGPARFDLLLSTTIRVNRPLEHPGSTLRIRYRVQLAAGDPSRIFVNGLTQSVTALDPHTAEVEVRSVRPMKPAANAPLVAVTSGLASSSSARTWTHSATPASATSATEKKTSGATPTDRATLTAFAANPSGARVEMFSAHPAIDEDRQPNNLVQSDDPQIVALAKQAAGGKTDPWEVAQALERFVYDYIKVKNYSQAFSTAVEVAANREGACTQHAVLLAALARARGIPARVVVGLVYTEARPGFAFHMWNEVWIGDRWIPLDGTRGAGGIGAAYLKLADSSLNGQAAYTCFLPVTEVIGQAKIEILEVE